MAGYVPTRSGSSPVFSGVRQRVLICFLAASFALADWEWLPSVDLRSKPAAISTGVTINGTRVDLACLGRGDSSVIIVYDTVVTRSIDDAMQAELARYVRLCTLTVFESATYLHRPDLATLLPGLLIGGQIPAPYVIIAHTSPSTVSAWMSRPSTIECVGFVLINPPGEPTSLVVNAQGDRRPLPLDDRDATTLAILSLFWPPDEV